MKNRFMLLSMLLSIGASVTFTACDDDDNNGNEQTETNNVLVVENITENTTWENDRIYQLGGRIAVESGVTLTIEPGTVIKGEAGTGTNATALIISQGAKINAAGEPGAPIIFTSIADEITPEDIANGNFGSPNLENTTNGYWGGLIVLGKAPISVSEGTTAQIEGIPSTDPHGKYGGTNADDNSGVLKYVSIRHGGANIGEGNEINGLSLGGVGSGTEISNIEVLANQDDGIEFFGGTVDISNVVVWNVGDDGLDTDQGWNGTCNNFVIISSDGHLFELDGIEGDKSDAAEITKYGYHTFQNGYVIANTEEVSSGDLINLDRETNVHFENIYFSSVNNGQKIKMADLEDDDDNVIEEYVMPDDFLSGVDTQFSNVVINVSDVSAAVDGTATGVTSGNAPANPGAIDLTVFNNWSWAKQSGSITAW